MRLGSRECIGACVALMAWCANAGAQCDCTSIVGSCQATATLQDSLIEVTSDTSECSRVDYFVDGIPLVALVVEGSETQNWIERDEAPTVIVQSCQVCRAVAEVADQAFGGAGLYTDGEVSSLIEVSPVYPPDALAAGIEGYVELQFVVDMSGAVSAPEVIASEPAGVFDRVALDAIARWRYTRPTQEPQTVTERIEFNVADGLMSLRRPPDSEQPPAGRESPRRNNCLREDSRYDFGGMVDISLVNACEEPLMVYSCATGTGTLSTRWVCQNSEQSGALVGSDELQITRAPNSEYWLLACSVDDEACRSDGREWVRSLHRQPAAIDPQDRTRARLARSY